MFTVEAEPPEVARVARGPAAHDGLGDFGVELRGERAFVNDRLGPRGASSQFSESRRYREDVEMPLHPGADRDVPGVVGLHVVPADLRSRGPGHRAPESVGHHLGPEANAKERNTSVVGRAHQSRLGRHRSGHLVPVDAPLRPEEQYEIDPRGIGPLGDSFAMAFDEGVAVVTEAFPDESSVGIHRVGDDESTHEATPYVRYRDRRMDGTSAGASITADAIDRARSAGAGVVKHTPVTSSAALSERTGGDVVLKAENLQRTGSFKIRGGMAKIASLGDSARRGVTAGSAGNHAQALAFAARHHGVPCEIFVPQNAPIAKMAACRGYGATVIEGGDSLDEAVAAAKARAAETGMVFCHPYDDPVVVAGQATLGLELVVDLPRLRRVLVPLGGGGLAGGVALAVKRHDPSIKVIGVQVEACAPYANGMVPTGPVITLADGIAVKRPGDVTAPIVHEWLDDVVVVDEDAVADAMVLLMERSKLYVEGAGAVGVAALLAERVVPSRSGTTCVVLSGGNVDLGVVPGLIRRHETQAGRRLILFVRVSDRPGGLARLLGIFAEAGASVIDIEHVREGVDLHVRETGVNAVLEVRGPDHAEVVADAVRAAGYDVRAQSA